MHPCCVHRAALYSSVAGGGGRNAADICAEASAHPSHN